MLSPKCPLIPFIIPMCLRFFIAATLLLVLSTSTLRAEPPPARPTLSTTPVPPPESGIGADERPRILRAMALFHKRMLDEADQQLDGILQEFRKVMTEANVTYVSVASREELAFFQKMQKDKDRKVIWIDWAFGSALQAKALVAAERNKPETALAFLDEMVRYSPFRADAWTEKAFLLNRAGKAHEALKAYGNALELAEKYPRARASKAMALRGIGFSLIELKELAAAREAFRRSLVVEPGNKVAEQELRNIAELEQKKSNDGK